MGEKETAKGQPGKPEKMRSCVGLPAPNHPDLLPQLTGIPPPSPPVQITHLGIVCTTLWKSQAAEGHLQTRLPGEPVRVSVSSRWGQVRPPPGGLAPGPLPPCPAYHHSDSPVASEETGQEAGSWGIGCGPQGGNEGAGPWVDLDCNVCRAPFIFLNVMERPTLTTLAPAGIPSVL